MERIIWTDEKFSVGHKQIDYQHKELIKQLNQLIALQRQRGNKAQQLNIIKTLENYVETHLRYEEALLKKVGYPDLKEHQHLHSEYMIEVEMWSLMLDGDDPALLKRMCSFLQNWLTDHILGEDMKFKPYVKGR